MTWLIKSCTYNFPVVWFLQSVDVTTANRFSLKKKICQRKAINTCRWRKFKVFILLFFNQLVLVNGGACTYIWSGHTCPIRRYFLRLIVCINFVKLNVDCVIFTRHKKSSTNTANGKGNDGGKVPCQESFTRKCQVWTEGGSKRPLCFKTIV